MPESVDPLKILENRAAKEGQAKLAETLEVSLSYLNDILRGRREPGPKILAALGLERVVTYRRVG